MEFFSFKLNIFKQAVGVDLQQLCYKALIKKKMKNRTTVAVCMLETYDLYYKACHLEITKSLSNLHMFV